MKFIVKVLLVMDMVLIRDGGIARNGVQGFGGPLVLGVQGSVAKFLSYGVYGFKIQVFRLTSDQKAKT